jgi:hypothetical protein
MIKGKEETFTSSILDTDPLSGELRDPDPQ